MFELRSGNVALILFLISSSLMMSLGYRSKYLQRKVPLTRQYLSSQIGAIGSTLTNTDLAYEALGKFMKSPETVKIAPTNGGVNNIVQYCTKVR